MKNQKLIAKLTEIIIGDILESAIVDIKRDEYSQLIQIELGSYEGQSEKERDQIDLYTQLVKRSIIAKLNDLKNK